MGLAAASLSSSAARAILEKRFLATFESQLLLMMGIIVVSECARAVP